MIDKEKVIEEYLKSNLNKSRVAELLGVSRERIGQIIKEVYGTRNPLVNYATEIDWKLFNQIRNVFNIPVSRLGRMAGCQNTTVSRVLTNQKEYIKNSNKSRANVSVKIARAILKIAEKRLEKLVVTLDKLEKQT